MLHIKISGAALYLVIVLSKLPPLRINFGSNDTCISMRVIFFIFCYCNGFLLRAILHINYIVKYVPSRNKVYKTKSKGRCTWDGCDRLAPTI